MEIKNKDRGEVNLTKKDRIMSERKQFFNCLGSLRRASKHSHFINTQLRPELRMSYEAEEEKCEGSGMKDVKGRD